MNTEGISRRRGPPHQGGGGQRPDSKRPDVISESGSEVTSRVRLFATPWTVAYQAPPSVGFSRQECWSGLLFPSPGDLPNPGIEAGPPGLQADALPSEPPRKLILYEDT